MQKRVSLIDKLSRERNRFDFINLIKQLYYIGEPQPVTGKINSRVVHLILVLPLVYLFVLKTTIIHKE